MTQREAQQLEDWIDTTSALASGESWNAWPQAAHEEIVYVLSRNDAGTARVTALAMVDRLEKAHGVSIGRETLTKYCQKRLGRKGWRR